MSNTITNLLRTWLARGLPSFRRACVMTQLVMRDYDGMAQERGDRIRVPIRAPKTAAAVTPAMTPPTPSDTSNDKADIVLDQHQYTDLHLTDKELTQIDAGEFFVPAETEECMIGIAEAV